MISRSLIRIVAALTSLAIASPASITLAGQEHTRTARHCTMAPNVAAVRATTFRFPRDDAPHEGYAVEWWRSFGRVNDASGAAYDYHVDIQRFAVTTCSRESHVTASRWATNDILTMTYELLDERTRHVERAVNVERTGAFGAAIDAKTLDISGRFVHIRAIRHAANANARFAITWRTSDVNAIDITQSATGPALPLGPDGVMVTGTCATCRAYAYAYPRTKTSGTLRIAGHPYAVVGSTWFEHEYAQHELASDDAGWSRYEIAFDDGRALDVRFTHDAGGATVATSGVFVAANGAVTYLHDGDAELRNVMKTSWRSDASGVTYPSLWSLRVGPPANLGLATVEVALDQESQSSERTPYYAGAIVVERVGPPEGDHGHGYVELTGYDAPLSL
jgi:predicted secreted hydrolase